MYPARQVGPGDMSACARSDVGYPGDIGHNGVKARIGPWFIVSSLSYASIIQYPWKYLSATLIVY